MSAGNNELSQLETVSHQLGVLRKAEKCTKENDSIHNLKIIVRENYEVLLVDGSRGSNAFVSKRESLAAN